MMTRPPSVIPAEAGISARNGVAAPPQEIPACAGMTAWGWGGESQGLLQGRHGPCSAEARQRARRCSTFSNERLHFIALIDRASNA
ncbi:hypothetical protein ETR14_26050 [Sphingosinicella sp. BN140058]|nr:hypothetical protein ETR14_26050 [Sphingosinicella sp. BN140058]